jgi:hypothetical protein
MDKMKYVQLQDDGDVYLKPGALLNTIAPNGFKITPVVLSRRGITFRWFIDFLSGTKNDHDEKTYRAFRNADGVFLESIRGRIASIVGFSVEEVPIVLDELRYINSIKK